MKTFVIAGEISGDALAAQVLKKWGRQNIEGVIGPKLKALGARELFSIEEFQVMGFRAIIKSLPHFIKLFYKIRKEILNRNPEHLLLVDNAEFSLLIAKSLRKKGFKGKITQLVAPSVWAWRKGRIKTLEENFDELLSILPFEKKYFENSPLSVEYIGHPLIEELSQLQIPNRLNLGTKPIISLFPGSRKNEILTNLPLQLKAASTLTSHQVAIGIASEKFRPLIKSLGGNALLISPEDRFELMSKSQFALSKLGTINLELAYFGVPTITSFAIPKFEQFILQYLFKIFLPHYSLVNMLAERRLFPEYIGSFATLENLTREVKNFSTNKELRDWVIAGCAQVKKTLETQK